MGLRAAPPKPGYSPSHPPQCSMSVVLVPSPLGGDGVRMESGVLDTWDLVNRSGTGFWASFLPLNGHMMLVQYFSLDRGANHTYL